MTWVRLDDGFVEHDKVIGLSDRAFRIHIEAVSSCARNLTDGNVSKARALALGANGKISKELERAGLWDVNGDGWEIHDYLEYQLSAEQVRAQREGARERKRAQRQRGTGNSGRGEDGRFRSNQ